MIGAIAILAISLNHSSRIGAFNLSAADVILPVIILLFAQQRHLFAPASTTVFFAVVVATTSASALWVTPKLFNVQPNSAAIASDLIKSTASLLFFICGYSLARIGLQQRVLRWFSLGAIAVAFIGVLSTLAGFSISSMYYAGVRYKGFMIDPNYYATLSCGALVIVAKDPQVSRLFRLGSSALLIGSIVLSGSKTGIVALLAIGVLLTMDFIVDRHLHIWLIPLVGILGACTALLQDSILHAVSRFVSESSDTLPQLERIGELLDPGNMDVLNGGGSERAMAWATALDIVAQSPLVGGGAGSYQSIAGAISGHDTLAHNTYLQLAATWGLPLTILFFAWTARLIFRGWFTRNRDQVMLSSVVVVFLIASTALSLNNARMFWLFLGLLAFEYTSQTPSGGKDISDSNKSERTDVISRHGGGAIPSSLIGNCANRQAGTHGAK